MNNQQIIDLLINRYNFSQSDSGKVVFWNPSCTIESLFEDEEES